MPGILNRNDWVGLSSWMGGICLAAVILVIVNRSIASDHLRVSAERTAIDYAHLISTAVPELDELLAHGTPSPRALSQLKKMRSSGRVFRFKLFDHNGQLLLTSDLLAEPDFGSDGKSLGYDHGEIKDNVAQLINSRIPFVELKDGTKKSDRPDSYSEAYVPIVRDDRVIGVVEVYVDQTELGQEIKGVFYKVTAIVGAIMLCFGALGIFQLARRLRQQRQVEQRVHYLAQHDVLSGALNRASFQDVVMKAVWKHDASGDPFAILCLDLDRFKDVNDIQGHAAGDEVLRQTSSRLRKLLRHGDELARLGGDEFAILQADVSSATDVTTLAERAVECLAEIYEIDGQRIKCGCSIGAAIYGTDANEFEELMHKSDLALYRAKSNGRGGFSFYDSELDEQLQSRRALTSDLRVAIDKEQLTLAYQKLFSADGISFLGYEALLRWQHPEIGNIPPDQFISLAEDAGYIDKLGAWVLQKACMEAATWPENRSVAVNLSAAQFRHGDLVKTVQMALAKSGLPPSRLELEITESLLMSDTDEVIKTLRTLESLGIRISMDDFGTGYSSLAYLWQFPFHKLKIDKSFTQALSQDPKVELIIQSIVSLAHSLKIRVNAEGVETEDQLEILKLHGCDEFQGFLLGHPASADTLQHIGEHAQLEDYSTRSEEGIRIDPEKGPFPSQG